MSADKVPGVASGNSAPTQSKQPLGKEAVTGASHLCMVDVQPGQCPSSAPAPSQVGPGGPGQLGAPRKWPCHWDPSQCLQRR